MKRHMKLFIVLGLVLTGASVFGLSVSADSAEIDYQNIDVLTVDANGNYQLEDMLTYALLDEYHAKATYEAIIETYGEIRPFTNIVLAEQTHIDLLLPLFETYGYSVPLDDSNVVVPDSVASALATGFEAEKANIALYETFLAQDLPDDVRAVFEQLVNASEHHLSAFSRDRNFGAVYDIKNQIQNQFRRMFGKGSKQFGGMQQGRNF